MQSKESLSVFDWPSQKPHWAGTQCQRYTLLIYRYNLFNIPSLHCFGTLIDITHLSLTSYILVPDSSVGRVLDCESVDLGSNPTPSGFLFLLRSQMHLHITQPFLSNCQEFKKVHS